MIYCKFKKKEKKRNEKKLHRILILFYHINQACEINKRKQKRRFLISATIILRISDMNQTQETHIKRNHEYKQHYQIEITYGKNECLFLCKREP